MKRAIRRILADRCDEDEMLPFASVDAMCDAFDSRPRSIDDLTYEELNQGIPLLRELIASQIGPAYPSDRNDNVS